MNILPHIIVLCIVLLAFGTLQLLWKKTVDDIDHSTNALFMRDFHKTRELIKQMNIKDADKLIDQFEIRWDGLVCRGKLMQHIGRLVETQMQEKQIKW